MAQGRISFSGSFSNGRAFLASPDQIRENFETVQAASDGALRISGMMEARVCPFLPEVADQWIIESIERKRVGLRQVTQVQRHRIDEFVALLFDEETDRCHDLVEQAVAETGDPQKVVETLFEPAARLIGENWCTDECDFLKVTIAVSRMQRLFRRLAAEYPPSIRADMTRCALLTPAPGEQHMFGLSVVDDAFRRAGWEVDCCGVDEESAVMRLAASNHYQVIGVSVSVERRLPDLAVTLRKLRTKSRNRSVVLIAGGSMVMQNPQGVIETGFDLLAVDAPSAVALAEAVVTSSAIQSNQQMAAE